MSRDKIQPSGWDIHTPVILSNSYLEVIISGNNVESPVLLKVCTWDFAFKYNLVFAGYTIIIIIIICSH